MATTLTALPYAPSASTVTQRNLLKNPRGNGVSDWGTFAGAGGASSIGTNQPGLLMVGTDGAVLPASTRIIHTQTTTSTGIGGLFSTSAIGTVTPGVAYFAAAYVATGPLISVQVRLQFYTSAGVALGGASSAATPANSAAGGYVRPWATAAAPATASYAGIEIYSTTAIASGTAIVATCAQIGLGSTLVPYTDGSVRAPVGSLSTWDGAPEASASTVTTRSTGAGTAVLTLDVPGTLVLDLPEKRDSATVLHNVIGRSDPVPAFGPLRTRAGMLSIWCADYATAQAIVALYAIARVVMLRDDQAPGRDMYHVATNIPVALDGQSTDKRRWNVQVDYSEVYGTATLW